jgi:outer membrane protein assembly factor BamB
MGRTGVVALRLDTTSWTLSPVWKFDAERELVYKTACGTQPDCVASADPLTYGAGTGHGCGGVWSSPAVDVDGNTVFFGTANCDSDQAGLGTDTGGEAMWAVNLRTGAKVWHFTPRGPNADDDDFGASANLLPGGLVGEGSKDGVYYARHRATGAEAWTSHAAQAGHLTSGFAFGGFIGTTAVGAVSGSPAVIGASALSNPFNRFDGDNPGPDMTLLEDPGRMLSLHAIDAASGKVLWRSPLSRQAFGAVSVALSPDVAPGVNLGGVVFVPSTFSFSIVAVSADTGVPLWTHLLNGPPSSAPTIAGDSVYLGVGVTAMDLPIGQLSGIWAFELAA